MSERVVIEFDGVGKMYRLYKSRLESFLDITSLGRIAPWWNPKIENFWALRNVSFRLKSGSRLGIIGRNGAGKTTLLKLITGNVMPSEGSINIQGEVQALLEAGAGFHPEFTGYENVEASLIQNGLSHSEIKAAIDEIGEFTELAEYLRQPFKTYSAGMQARLVFTTATTIRPDILIVDEILGAGDAYFAVKSRSRMRQLVESGASILLVSHALDQIIQFCDEAIWLERGRIVLRGPSMEVVKAYQEFIHALQDRQLKAANRRRRLGFRDAVEVGHFSDTFILALSLIGSPGIRADFASVELRCDAVAEEIVRIGDPQDSDQTQFAYVAMNTGTWSEPEAEGGGHYRSLQTKANGAAGALGDMVFRICSLEPGKVYSFRIRYRVRNEGRLTATASRNGQAIVLNHPMPTGSGEWQEFEVVLPLESPIGACASVKVAEAPPPRNETQDDGTSATVAVGEAPPDASFGSTRALRRWRGEGILLIDNVLLLDGEGRERAIFNVGSPLTVRIHYHAARTGRFPVIYSLVIFRVDGIGVSQHISDGEIISTDTGERHEVSLEFSSVDLADGRYVISVALHRELDPQFPNETIRYDLLDRSFEFEVVGNPPLRTSLFVLPARWNLQVTTQTKFDVH